MNETPSRTRDVERDLRLAQAEIRQLHETIGVLREELELQAEGTQQKVQQIMNEVLAMEASDQFDTRLWTQESIAAGVAAVARFRSTLTPEEVKPWDTLIAASLPKR